MTVSEQPVENAAAAVLTANVSMPVREAQPYGFLGLILSSAGIILLGALLLAVAAVIWILFAGLGSVQSAMSGMGGVDINEFRNAPHQLQMVFYGITAATFIAFGLAVLAFARLRGGAQWRDPIAWTEPTGWPRGRNLALLIALALLYLFVAGYGIKLIFPNFRTWFFVPGGAAGIALSFVTVVLLAPWAEELFFRGWIYSSLRRSFGVWAGVLITTLVFAALHIDASGLYPFLIFLPGLAITLIREQNSSTKASFYAHASYNGMAWIIVYFLGNP